METQVIALTMIAGTLLSLGVEYLPKVKDWYATRLADSKRQIMGLLLVISAGGAYLLGCYSPFFITACTEAGAWELVWSLVLALLAGASTNQATHTLTKKTKKLGEKAN